MHICKKFKIKNGKIKKSQRKKQNLKIKKGDDFFSKTRSTEKPFLITFLIETKPLY